MNGKMKRLTAIVFSIALITACVFSGGVFTNADDKKNPVSEDDVIRVISPVNGEKINADNDSVADFFENYKFDYGKEFFGRGELLPMKQTELSWDCESGAYYQVFVDTDINFKNPDKYVTIEKKLSLENLVPETVYYWKVGVTDENGESVFSHTYEFSVKASVRTVKIEGVSNVRDLGGAKTADGKIIRYGLVYRSANADSITKNGLYQARRLGIKTDLDLRGDAVRVSPLGKNIKLIKIQGAYYLGNPTGINGSEQYRNAFRDELKALAEEKNYPVLFHCAIGRDRTGTLSAFLQAILGVSKDDIVREYELSYLSEAGCRDGNKNMADAPRVLCDFINAQSGATFAEKAANYALNLGVTTAEIASIRRILLG